MEVGTEEWEIGKDGGCGQRCREGKEGGKERCWEGNEQKIQVKTSKANYIQILYMYFCLRVVYYKCMYTYRIRVF